MKRNLLIAILSCFAIFTTISPNNQENNSNYLETDAKDVNNDTISLKLRNSQIGDNENVRMSKTYVQYGSKDNKHYLRFATAISGPIKTATYTRSGATTETDTKVINIVYQGILSENNVVYYNDAGETDSDRLTNDEAYKGQYYWACYTIAFETENHLDEVFNLQLSIVGENDQVYNAESKSASLNQLLDPTQEKNASIDSLRLAKENDRVFYCISGSYTGEIDKEFIYFDLKNKEGNLNLAGKDNMILTLDSDKSIYTMKADITDIMTSTTLLYYFPTVYINNVEQDLTDSSSYKKTGTYIADSNSTSAYRIDQNKNTNNLPAVRRENKTTVPSDASFTFTSAKMEQINARIYYCIIGQSTGYDQASLALNIPNFKVRYSSETYFNNAANTGAMLLTCENNNFELKFDVTDLTARRANYNPYYVQYTATRTSNTYSYLSTINVEDVDTTKTITFNNVDYIVFYKNNGEAVNAANGYGSLGFKLISK